MDKVGMGAASAGAILSLAMGLGSLASVGGVSEGDRATVIILGGLFTGFGLAALAFVVSSIRDSKRWTPSVKSPESTERPRPVASPRTTGAATVVGSPDLVGRRTPSMVEPAPQPAASTLIQTRPALWGYMAEGPVWMEGAQTDEDLEADIRKDFAGEDSPIRFFTPQEWDAPAIPSLSERDLGRVFPQIIERAHAHMAKSGLPPVPRDELVSTAEVRTNPGTGTLVFLFRVRVPSSLEGDVPSRRTQEGNGVLREGEGVSNAGAHRDSAAPGAHDVCHVCGKEVHTGPEVEIMTISVSDGEDPFAAMESAADRMLARKLVCETCGEVVCLECVGEEGQATADRGVICPVCRTAGANDPAQDLLVLKARIESLMREFPRKEGAGGAGAERAKKQIPWISRELGAASEALVSGRDPTGKAISEAQVSGGLRKLAEYVTAEHYGTVMEMVYPGINGPLQACMDQLEAIIGQIERM